MKTVSTIVCLWIASLLSLTAQTTTWYDRNWNSLPSKDGAAYYRVSVEDTLQQRFLVQDFDLSGRLYRIGTFITLVPEIRDGVFQWFHKNGRLHKEVVYEGNKVVNWRVMDEKGRAQLVVVVTFAGAHGEELAEVMPVDKEPSFVGGSRALNAYVRKHLEYPPITAIEPLEGAVLVYFVVMEDGTLTQVRVARSLHPDLDKAALDMVSSMPAWEPGTVGDQPVAVPYVMTVKFQNRSAQSFSRNNVAGSRSGKTY